MLKPGLYEQVVNKKINSELTYIPKERKEVIPIDEAESSKILSQYLEGIIQKGLDNVVDNNGNIKDQIDLTNKIIDVIKIATKENEYTSYNVTDSGEQLLSLLKEKDPRLALNNGLDVKIRRPETSISQSSLFTGSKNEPQMFSELKNEIISSDKIDMLVSFIKWSGLRLIIDELREFTQNGGKLRIITTSYMGATDVKAIEELEKLSNTEIKVSYDTKRTRLHAKTYVFYRETGFTTAYVGSSNLSNAAISSGLEWNIKVTKTDLPETIKKISASFESYWNADEFEYYSEEQRERLAKALKAEKYHDSSDMLYTLDVTPYSYQKEILDELEAERVVRGYNRNLVVAATGTGKTVISALDYKRFCHQHKGEACRLLFVAHREEILKQSINTFRAVLKDANFGDLYVGNYKPEKIDYLFTSIQTFISQDFTSKTEKHFYDYIIVDEFHHAAAPTYQKLLEYYEPKILLGLTATPERMDGKSILEYFNNRIAAEIRLPEAIDRKLLSPFQYFGVTDGVDLSGLKWSRGGYDKKELSNIYTLTGVAATKRAENIINSVFKYVTDIEETKGLGFCVSIEHAKFMSDFFNSHNIASICLTGNSSDEERNTAKYKLVSGEIKFIFVVDIYNEGVDIPEVNTVLFLRPTESLTIFLQQLGRGLRLAENKDCLTVLDFIGQANKKYNFEDKFSALLSDPTKNIERQIKKGNFAVPKGCYIKLEKKASHYILDNIRQSYGSVSGLISRISSFEFDTGMKLTFANFLNYYHMNIKSLYKHTNMSYSRMCVRAGVIPDFNERLEQLLTKSFPKFCSVDSRRWLSFLLKLLKNIDDTDFESFNSAEKHMTQMFYVTIWNKPITSFSDEFLYDMRLLSNNKILLSELIDILQYKYDSIDFIDEPVDLGFECPLDLHCTYSRDQILVALDFMKPSTVREGIKWLPNKNTDLLFVTLNKADKDYSPTTMYNDYSISENLFHWQSQSTTSEDSPTGQRYIHHRERGSNVLLFVREYKSDQILGSAESYVYLGKAAYVSHEGSRPMNITWKLKSPIPPKFLKKANKLVIG